MTSPACRGHNPAATLNKEDFPEPLGPMMMTLDPGGTSKESSRSKGVPSGEERYTLLKETMAPSTLRGSGGGSKLPSGAVGGAKEPEEDTFRRKSWV